MLNWSSAGGGEGGRVGATFPNKALKAAVVKLRGRLRYSCLTGSTPKRITLWAGDVIHVGGNTAGCAVPSWFLKGDVHLLIRAVK